MNAYITEFLVRDHIAELYVSAGRDRLFVHVPESPPPGPRPVERLAAWARTILHVGRLEQADPGTGGRLSARHA